MAKIEFLDHVAIKVANPEFSATWYCDLLDLERYQPEEWKPVPIMVQAGNSGIAIFQDKDEPVPMSTKDAFHIAFRVEPGGLTDIEKNLEDCNIPYTKEDHIYFKSLYFRDPDGYRLEVTMKVD